MAKLLKGEISLGFKDSATLEQIAQIVAECTKQGYQSIPLFPEDKDDPLLSRMYTLKVPDGKEDAVIADLKKKYGTLFDYAERMPDRFTF